MSKKKDNKTDIPNQFPDFIINIKKDEFDSQAKDLLINPNFTVQESNI